MIKASEAEVEALLGRRFDEVKELLEDLVMRGVNSTRLCPMYGPVQGEPLLYEWIGGNAHKDIGRGRYSFPRGVPGLVVA